MEIDYLDIMDGPEPLDGADLAVLDNVCCVYQFLVDKFTRLLYGPREPKDCWMQQERFAYFAKKLAFNARALRRANHQLRQGEIVNFGLRVRRWVLRCAERRLKMRALIGEARIQKWEDKRRDYEAGHYEITHTKKKREIRVCLNQSADKRPEIGNWYGLPKFPKRPCQEIEKSEIKSAEQGQDYRAQSRNFGGMHRPNPVIVFWPDELVPDCSDENNQQNYDAIEPCGHLAIESESGKVLRGNISKISPPKAREGPD